jgi:hypothetical protein
VAIKAWANTKTFPVSARERTKVEIEKHSHVLTPGRYVGAEEIEGTMVKPFEKKMKTPRRCIARPIRRVRSIGKSHQYEPERVGICPLNGAKAHGAT